MLHTKCIVVNVMSMAEVWCWARGHAYKLAADTAHPSFMAGVIMAARGCAGGIACMLHALMHGAWQAPQITQSDQ